MADPVSPQVPPNPLSRQLDPNFALAVLLLSFSTIALFFYMTAFNSIYLS
jgi:hypothetical protein